MCLSGWKDVLSAVMRCEETLLGDKLGPPSSAMQMAIHLDPVGLLRTNHEKL